MMAGAGFTPMDVVVTIDDVGHVTGTVSTGDAGPGPADEHPDAGCAVGAPAPCGFVLALVAAVLLRRLWRRSRD
jgi:hypothetical protein